MTIEFTDEELEYITIALERMIPHFVDAVGYYAKMDDDERLHNEKLLNEHELLLKRLYDNRTI